MVDSTSETTELRYELISSTGEVVGAVTEDELIERLNETINVTDVTVSMGETRQLRQYEPNNYHMSFKSSIEGFTDVLALLGTDHRKAVKKLFLSLLTAKLAGQIASMKRFMHAEQIKDGFDVNQIDWRKGEKEMVLKEE